MTSRYNNLPAISGRYANDGKCHNAEPGTYNHECGKPAQWVGYTIKPSGETYGSCFCDKCKRNGYEARGVDYWRQFIFPTERMLLVKAEIESLRAELFSADDSH